MRVLACALVAASLPLLAAPAVQAQGPSGPSTDVYVLHLEGQPFDNSCNGDVTVLRGELTIVTTHIPTRDGGEIVQGNAVTTNLVGSGLPSGLTYRAAHAEVSFVRYLPPERGGYTSTDLMLWLLVPDGDAPTMYLATVLRETVRADETATTSLDRRYLISG